MGLSPTKMEVDAQFMALFIEEMMINTGIWDNHIFRPSHMQRNGKGPHIWPNGFPICAEP
jgi:hypothetical protein